MSAFLTKAFRCVSVAKSQSLINSRIATVIFQRNIYGDNYLAIDNFLQQRERVMAQFHDTKEKFTAKMREIVTTDKIGMVFTEDLKHMIHLAENKPEDFDLLVEMVKKHSTQSTEFRFSRYVFGPVVMRLLHHLGNHELAFQLLKDDEMSGFFDQIISFTIGMDLLFKSGKYQQVIDLFQVVLQRHIVNRYPRDPFVLVLAACYKLNTPEALELSTQWLQQAKEAEAVILRKAVTLAAALAIKQNNPTQALEILSITTQYHYFTVKNLRVIGLVRLDRMEDALRILKSAVERDIPTEKKSKDFCEETLSIVKEAINISGNKEHSLIFQRLELALREMNVVAKETLDESICAPILERPVPKQDSRSVGFESKFFVSSRDREQMRPRERQNFGMRSRHGLLDSED